MAVTDPAERALGCTTQQVEVFGRVGLANAGGVASARANGVLDRGATNLTKRRKADRECPLGIGFFHDLDPKLRDALLQMAVEHEREQRKQDRADLAKQRDVRHAKEELARACDLASGEETYIDALYYHEMYLSAACWKTAEAVDAELKKLKSAQQRLEHLKEQIRMRELGLGWTDAHHPWSKDGKDFTAPQLATHLKQHISLSATRPVPSAPPLPLRSRKPLPQLGDEAGVAELDKGHSVDSATFEASARAKKVAREATGIGDPCAEKQSTSPPEVDAALVGVRLEYLFDYLLEDGSGSEPRWSSGVVTQISDGKNLARPSHDRYLGLLKPGEGVEIDWDADASRGEPGSKTVVVLKPRQWNPKGDQRKEGGWRKEL